jgi:hypothetical protein
MTSLLWGFSHTQDAMENAAYRKVRMYVYIERKLMAYTLQGRAANRWAEYEGEKQGTTIAGRPVWTEPSRR